MFTVTVVQDLADIPPQVLKVPNSSSSLLPEAGGIGTYIFIGAGAVLMILAAFLLLRKKKSD